MADITRKDWIERTSEERVAVADAVLKLIDKEVRFDYQLSYTNSYIGVRSGDKQANFFVVYPKKKATTLAIWVKQKPEFDELLQSLFPDAKYKDTCYYINLESNDNIEALLPILLQSEKELVEWKGEDYLTPKAESSDEENEEIDPEFEEKLSQAAQNLFANFAPKSDIDEQKKLEDLATLIICTTIAGDGSSTGAEIVAASKKAEEYGFDGDKLREAENDIWANKFVNAEELDLEAMAREATQNLDSDDETWQFIDICSEVLLVDQENINEAAYILRVFGDEAGLSQMDIIEKLKRKLAGEKESVDEDGEEPEDVMDDEEWEDVESNEVNVEGDVATISDGTVSLRDVDFSEAEECKKLIIPEGVKCICRGEIELEKLESIEFPESLKVIEEEALDECPNLNAETLAAIKQIQEKQIINKEKTYVFVDLTDEFDDYDEVLDEWLDGQGYFEEGKLDPEADTENREQDCIEILGKYEEEELFDYEVVNGINLGSPGLYIENAEAQLYTLVWRGERILSFE